MITDLNKSFLLFMTTVPTNPPCEAQWNAILFLSIHSMLDFSFKCSTPAIKSLKHFSASQGCSSHLSPSSEPPRMWKIAVFQRTNNLLLIFTTFNDCIYYLPTTPLKISTKRSKHSLKKGSIAQPKPP